MTERQLNQALAKKMVGKLMNRVSTTACERRSSLGLRCSHGWRAAAAVPAGVCAVGGGDGAGAGEAPGRCEECRQRGLVRGNKSSAIIPDLTWVRSWCRGDRSIYEPATLGPDEIAARRAASARRLRARRNTRKEKDAKLDTWLGKNADRW